MTMFISHTDTQYRHVADFHRRGMEIAAHSVTHAHMNGQNFYTEAKNQKRNLAKYGKFPESDIVGWRSPFLEPVGDLQPETLKKLGYMYDATLTFSKRRLNDSAPTPFTLDFGWPYDCKVKPCPRDRHPGFWEVPVVSLLDYLHRYDCVYVDGCMNIPPNEESAYQFLMDNFNSYYQRERIPFGINMHPSWFYTGERLKAMDRFIMDLVSRQDVFIVSVKKTLDWLKNPTPLSQINSFQPWQCKPKIIHKKRPVRPFHAMAGRSFMPPPPSAFQVPNFMMNINSRTNNRISNQHSMGQQRKEPQIQNKASRIQTTKRRLSNTNSQRSARPTTKFRSMPGTPLIRSVLANTEYIQGPPKVPRTLKPTDNTNILSHAFGQVFWSQGTKDIGTVKKEVPTRRHFKSWDPTRTNVPNRRRKPVNGKPKFEFQLKIPHKSPVTIQRHQRHRKTSLQSQLDMRQNKIRQPKLNTIDSVNYNDEVISSLLSAHVATTPLPLVANRAAVIEVTTMSIYDRMEQQILRERRLRKEKERRLADEKIILEKQKRTREIEQLNIDKSQQRKLEEQMKLEVEIKREKEIGKRKLVQRQTHRENQRRQRNIERRPVPTAGSRGAVSPRRSTSEPSRQSGRKPVGTELEKQWKRFIKLLMKHAQ